MSTKVDLQPFHIFHLAHQADIRQICLMVFCAQRDRTVALIQIGVTAVLVLAYALVKDKKETMGFERTMRDGEILRRLAGYAKPYWAKFIVVR